MNPRKAILTIGAALLLVMGRAAAGAPADPVEVSLRLRPDSAYEVAGNFSIDASTTEVWAVLSDFESIPKFVDSMRLSRVKEARQDGSWLIEQEAVGGMFLISKKVRVLLEVARTDGSMAFNDVGRKDFWIYSGRWEVARTPDGTRVDYHLLAQPDFPAPSFILKGVMRRGARDLLAQVRREIERRAHPLPGERL